MLINIQSFGDIITNSSSETFIIKNSGGDTIDDVPKRFYNFIESRYGQTYGTRDAPAFSGVYDADFYTKPDGSIVVDYQVMCNLDEGLEILEEIYGKGNVSREESDY
jgi:hypothetical protein